MGVSLVIVGRPESHRTSLSLGTHTLAWGLKFSLRGLKVVASLGRTTLFLRALLEKICPEMIHNRGMLILVGTLSLLLGISLLSLN